LKTGAPSIPPELPFSFNMQTTYFGLSAGKKPTNQQYFISIPFSLYCPLWAVAVFVQESKSDVKAAFPVPAVVVFAIAHFIVLQVIFDSTLLPSFWIEGVKFPLLSTEPL